MVVNKVETTGSLACGDHRTANEDGSAPLASSCHDNDGSSPVRRRATVGGPEANVSPS
jgi:hypothetical protein